jgi:hypothetical protein
MHTQNFEMHIQDAYCSVTSPLNARYDAYRGHACPLNIQPTYCDAGYIFGQAVVRHRSSLFGILSSAVSIETLMGCIFLAAGKRLEKICIFDMHFLGLADIQKICISLGKCFFFGIFGSAW